MKNINEAERVRKGSLLIGGLVALNVILLNLFYVITLI